MNNQQAQELLKKYTEGTVTKEEKDLVESWFLKLKSEQSIDDLPNDVLENDVDEVWSALKENHLKIKSARLWPHIATAATLTDAEREQLKQELFSAAHSRIASAATPKAKIATLNTYLRMASAAAILLLLGAGLLFYTHRTKQNQTAARVNDVAPGKNSATLTLANGNQIVLTGAQNGKLAVEGNAAVTKTADGNVIYNSNTDKTNNTTQLVYNSMSTPIGGQYHLVLADGTNVWLNAASSIKYPTTFTGDERKVEITGEVYFEVAHNAAKPFRVISNQQVIEVLGTHFNVNAYADEAGIKTTLLEGSVKVTVGKNDKVIKPGQQLLSQGGELSVSEADLDEAVAWKNGYFKFNDEKISSVMHKLSRWYNIDVQYQGKASDEGFNGAISRFKNISQVLKMLEKTKAVHFKIEGRRVTVIQ